MSGREKVSQISFWTEKIYTQQDFIFLFCSQLCCKFCCDEFFGERTWREKESESFNATCFLGSSQLAHLLQVVVVLCVQGLLGEELQSSLLVDIDNGKMYSEQLRAAEGCLTWRTLL